MNYFLDSVSEIDDLLSDYAPYYGVTLDSLFGSVCTA